MCHRQIVIFLNFFVLLSVIASPKSYEYIDDPDEVSPTTDRRFICEEDNSCIAINEFRSDSKSLKFYEVPKKNIQKLIFEGQAVEAIPDNTFDIFPNLKEIHFSRTVIKSITVVDFEKFTNLKTLTIEIGELTDICGRAFEKLEYLERLDLSVNEIKFLHPKLFEKLANLLELELSYNSIEFLHPRLFNNLKKLEILNIGNNNLIYIDDLQFSSNTQLEYISAETNDLKVIGSLAFSSLKNLNHLILFGNPCTVGFVPEHIEEDDELPTSDEILLSKINLTNIPAFFRKNCNDISSSRKDIESRISSNNRHFKGKFVIEKCGHTHGEEFDEFYYSLSDAQMNKIDVIFVAVLACFVAQIAGFW